VNRRPTNERSQVKVHPLFFAPKFPSILSGHDFQS
jgi:hypothetical protein